MRMYVKCLGKSVAHIKEAGLKVGVLLIYHLNWDSSEKGYYE